MSFLKNLFSGKNSKKVSIEDFLDDLFQMCGWEISCDVDISDKIYIDLYGKDEQELTDQKGRLLQSFQVYISSAIQNRLKEKAQGQIIVVDSGGYLNQYEQDVLELANKLKKEALRKKRPVIIKRPLSPMYRRKVHHSLTKDGRVETKSMGYGVFKTIKIFPLIKKRRFHGKNA